LHGFHAARQRGGVQTKKQERLVCLRPATRHEAGWNLLAARQLTSGHFISGDFQQRRVCHVSEHAVTARLHRGFLCSLCVLP
jgi:hypothetical protein